MPYVLQSFDSRNFLELIENPTPKQFDKLLKLFRKAIDQERESYCDPDDPACLWGTAQQPLDVVLRTRLSQADWYNDLTYGAGVIWDVFIDSVQSSKALGMAWDLECEGLSWEFIGEVNHRLAESGGSENASFLAFGKRPYRYFGGVPDLQTQHPHGDDLAGGLQNIQTFLAKCQKDPLRFQELLDEDETLNPAQKKMVLSLFNQCAKEEDEDADFWDDDDSDTAYEPTHSIHLKDELVQMIAAMETIKESMRDDEELMEGYEELVRALEKCASHDRALRVVMDT